LHIFIRTKKPRFYLKFAKRADVPEIMSLVRGLAEYENLLGSVTSTDALLEKSLFDEKVAEVILGYYEGKAVCFALFFRNFAPGHAGQGLWADYVCLSCEAFSNPRIRKARMVVSGLEYAVPGVL